MVLDRRRKIAGQNFARVVVDRKHRETLGVAFLPEDLAPDDAERVGVHRRFMAVLLHVFGMLLRMSPQREIYRMRDKRA